MIKSGVQKPLKKTGRKPKSLMSRENIKKNELVFKSSKKLRWI